MQKGYKREGRGMAVLHFFFGLFVVIVLVLLAYLLLRLDYTDKLSPDASIRPYVEVTPSPVPTATPEVTKIPAVVNTALPEEATQAPSTENSAPTATPTDLPTHAPTAAPTDVPTTAPTEAPTPEPTAEPTVEPTAEPTATPGPTSIPTSAIAQMKFDGYTMPNLSTKNAKLGITHSYRSAVDGNKYLHLQGYAYVDESGYDGATATPFLVIIRSTGHTALALPTKVAGVSGGSHASAQCANAAASDFDVVLDVSNFPEDSYTLGMVLSYTDSATGEKCLEYFTFPPEMSFSVLNKQIISDVKTVIAE